MRRFQLSKILVIPFFALNLVSQSGFASEEDEPDQQCKPMTQKAQTFPSDVPPVDGAKAYCEAAKKNAEKTFAKENEKTKKELDLEGEENKPSLKLACEATDKMDAKVADLQTKITTACKKYYTDAINLYAKRTQELEQAAASIPNCRESGDFEAASKALQFGSSEAEQKKATIEHDYKANVAKVEKSAKQAESCKQFCAGEDCSKEKSTSDEEDSKTAKSKSSNGLNMGSMASMALPAIMALMGMRNQQQQAELSAAAALPVATDVAGDSCLRPENFSNPSCKCYLTGDCRNAESAAPMTIGAMPGSGGAVLAKPDASAADLNLGGTPLQMPAIPPNHDSGGGAGGGGFGGGGGGFGGNHGGGGPHNSENAGAGGRARSGLSADILQGVRGGNPGGGGFANRSNPGFSDPEERRAKQMNRANTQTDLKEFMPTVRFAASSERSLAVSGSTLTLMHPANSNIFVEIRKAYNFQQPTLIGDL